MKKISVLAVLALMAMLSTGCGNKHLIRAAGRIDISNPLYYPYEAVYEQGPTRPQQQTGQQQENCNCHRQWED